MKSDPSRLFAVILAGGSGTRLWPASRGRRPKHLLSFFGQSLLQRTTARLLAALPPERIFAVTHRDHHAETMRQLEAIAPIPRDHILAEPIGRNTLPASLWACLLIAQKDPNAIAGLFPSDHLILDEERFLADLEAARKTAENGFMTTFGIVPTGPETGYGYIRTGDPIGDGAFRAKAFLEKPSRQEAESLIAAGGHYWNSGMFVLPVATFLEETRKSAPSVWETFSGIGDLSDAEAVAKAYAYLPSLSIDTGVMERSNNIATIPASFGWTDLGSWESVYESTPKDQSGNAVQGRVLADDVRASLLISNCGPLAVIGVKDMIIIRSEDAVLVCPRDRAQDVRKLADAFPGEPVPMTVERPWGRYTVLEEGTGYKLKKLTVDPRQKLSLQRHKQRAEHWVVIEGTAKVTNDDRETVLQKNESTFIPKGQKHRLENIGESPLVIIEVQTGEYVGEDDIERFEDIYGRPISA